MNSDTQRFDLTPLKDNLRALMDKNGLTQEQFGAIAGIAQSTISEFLSYKKSTKKITVEQLAAYAIHFGVSVDDLLGISPAKNTDTTLTAALEKMFDLDKITDMEIGYFELKPGAPAMIYALYFKSERLRECLEQWHELKSTNLQSDTKEQVMKLWRESQLEDGKDRRKEWEYRNEVQQAVYLSTLLVDFYESMRKSYELLPPEYKPATENEHFETEKSKTPFELLDTKNRALLEKNKSVIVENFLLSKEQSETFREALEWLLNNTKSFDFK